MTVKVVALVTINENEAMALAKYLDLTTPLLDRVGAKIVERYQLDKDVVGATRVRTVVVVEYPSRDAVDEVFSSPEYRAAVPYRDLAFSDYSVAITT